jgi:exodeoxyribonuclease VII large subunit
MSYYLLVQRAQLRDLVESRGFSETAGAVISHSTRCRELERRAFNAIKNNLLKARIRLQDAGRKIEVTDFRAPIAIKAARMDALSRRIDLAIQRRLERQRHALALVASKLNALSPLSVLGRGYALVKDESGRLVPRAAMVRRDQKLNLRFEDGEVGCRVI